MAVTPFSSSAYYHLRSKEKKADHNTATPHCKHFLWLVDRTRLPSPPCCTTATSSTHQPALSVASTKTKIISSSATTRHTPCGASLASHLCPTLVPSGSSCLCWSSRTTLQKLNNPLSSLWSYRTYGKDDTPEAEQSALLEHPISGHCT
jgi:hypothetical protein